MSEHTVSPSGAATAHSVAVPGGTIYYRLSVVSKRRKMLAP